MKEITKLFETTPLLQLFDCLYHIFDDFFINIQQLYSKPRWLQKKLRKHRKQKTHNYYL